VANGIARRILLAGKRLTQTRKEQKIPYLPAGGRHPSALGPDGAERQIVNRSGAESQAETHLLEKLPAAH
jgi:hypothetical protein